MSYQIIIRSILKEDKNYYVKGSLADVNEFLKYINLVKQLSDLSRVEIKYMVPEPKEFPINILDCPSEGYLNNYVLFNFDVNAYVDLSKYRVNPITLLCFADNDFTDEPYTGLFEDWVGAWANSRIAIVPKDRIKYYKGTEVYIDFKFNNGSKVL